MALRLIGLAAFAALAGVAVQAQDVPVVSIGERAA